LFGFMQLALRDVIFVCMKRTELRAPFISYCQTWDVISRFESCDVSGLCYFDLK